MEIRNSNGQRTGLFTTGKIKNGVHVLYNPQKSKSPGRKRFGPGTAKNYNDRVCKNSFDHYSDRCDENGWNAINAQ